jgi:glucans biosynthesis protein C
MTSASMRGRTAAPDRRRVAPRRLDTTTPQPAPTKPRYHAFDALRGTAMFLVIGLHAAIGYVSRDIPGVLWCVRDAPTIALFDWFCWWSMGVSNPLYFTIAGFFAVGLYDSRGFRAFLVNRARRILIPFLVGVVTVLPVCLCVWIYGWLVSGRCTWRQALKLKFLDPLLHSERMGTAHLWFLEYLIVMLLAYGVARRWGDGRIPFRSSLRTSMKFVLGSRWRPLLLAAPTTALLWYSRHRLGVDAALDRHNSFLINPVKFLYHGAFFAVGAGLYRMRHDLDRLERTGPLYLVLSLPVFVARAWLLGHDWTIPLVGAWPWLLALTGAVFAWLIVFGFIGTALRLVTKSQPALRYLADSSYWIYLIHMPILGLIQVDLYRLPGHALWKFPLVLAGTLAVGFASYQTLVRHTAIGTALHGRRERAR